MNIIVTGGAGFIGSHVVNMHINKGDNVTVIDNFQTSRSTNINPKASLVVADLAMVERIPMLEHADIVYHLASSVGVKLIDKKAREAIQKASTMNANLFRLFEKYNNRVIFSSTSEVYGNAQDSKETDTLQIGNPDKLRWGYACEKLMAEFLLKTYNFPSTVVRFFNVTGSGQLSDYGMVLPSFVEKAKKNQDIIIYGDGKQTRTFCDIRDAVNMLYILTDESHINETYNVGNSNNTISINDLARTVIDLSNSKSKIQYKSYETEFSDQFGEIFNRKPNTDKINNFYIAKYTLKDTILSML